MKNENTWSVFPFIAFVILGFVLLFQDYENTKVNFLYLFVIYFLGGGFLLFAGLVMHFSKTASITKKDKRFTKGYKVTGERDLNSNEIESNKIEARQLLKSGIIIFVLGIVLFIISNLV